MTAELAVRRKEALRLYEPSPEQDAFHRSRARIRLARGGNRGGKTLAACVELARAITCQDPHKKWPKKGRFIVAGKDLLHISKVIYRKLFLPGAFRIIKDLETGRWRTYRPALDAEREDKTEEAPPLIVPRYFREKAISWENKREGIPRTIPMLTGWEMTFFSGEGQPPQGWDVDGVLFDEEIPHPGWFREMLPRLVDRRGRMIWSATPQVGTAQLFELSERALEEAREDHPRVTEHFMKIDLNPFLSDAAKAEFKADLVDDEDEYQVRVEGNFAIHGMRVYGDFQARGIHRINPFPIPDTWTRYVAVDPGRQVAAALFVAVPPPNDEMTQPVVYDEIYYRKCNAQLFAREMKRHIVDHWVHGWLIDSHEGRKHDTGSGKTVEEQYADELRKLEMGANGFRGFTWAMDDVAAGHLAAKATLHVESGQSRWLFQVENLHWFCWEIQRYVDKPMTSGGKPVDRTSRSNLHNHLMDTFRYLALHPIRYVAPPKRTAVEGWTNRYLAKKRRKRIKVEGWGTGVRLG